MLASVENLKSSLSNMHVTIMDKFQNSAPVAAAPMASGHNHDGNTSRKGEQEYQEKQRAKENKKLNNNIKNRGSKKVNHNIVDDKLRLLKLILILMAILCAVVLAFCAVMSFSNKISQVAMAEIESSERVRLARIKVDECEENIRLNDIKTEKDRDHQLKINLMPHLQAQYEIESHNAAKFKQDCDNARRDWKQLLTVFSSHYQQQLKMHTESLCDEYAIQKQKVEKIQKQMLNLANYKYSF